VSHRGRVGLSAMRYTKILLALVFALTVLVGFPCPGESGKIDDLVKPDPPIVGVLDFSRCIMLALQQSPYLTSSALDIDLKRLDVSDAKYSFFPSFSLRTLYYVNTPTPVPGADSTPYALVFVTEQYNPIEVYFNFKARKLITQIAVYAHMQNISDFLQRLSLGFLELETVDRMLEYQDEIISVLEQQTAYTKNKLETGGVTIIDVQMSEQQLALAVSEKERLAESKITITEAIRNLVGLKPTDTRPDFELLTAKRQILNDFDPAAATLERILSTSLEMKIQVIRKQIQEKNIQLAYLRFLPNIVWGVQTLDPLTTRQDSGIFFFVGLEIPIWDGLKRYHNVDRQKILLKQNIAEGETKESTLTTKWRDSQQLLRNARADLNMIETQEKLAAYKEKNAEISYRAGGQPLSGYLGERKTHLEIQKAIISKKLQCDKAMLTLSALSGDLFERYIQTNNFYEKTE